MSKLDLPWEKICRSILERVYKVTNDSNLYPYYTNGHAIQKMQDKWENGRFIFEAEARKLWEMKQENKRLRKALRIYANKDNWRYYYDDQKTIWLDEDYETPWIRAQEALEGK